jgi:hypothetical protein
MRPRLTYANVMATVAVFIALGGASYAAIKLPKNSVGTKQLKKGAVTEQKVRVNGLTGTSIDESTLGLVPSATHATSADSATRADSATKATYALTADDASTLGGKGPAAFAPSSVEPWHELGSPGEPALVNSWTNLGGDPQVNQGVWSTAAFRRDPDGLVHLKGVVTGGKPSGTQAIFSLPPGFRPEQGEVFPSATAEGSAQPGWTFIGATGSPYEGRVLPFTGGKEWFSIDGITFLCGPPGQDGCPAR